MDSECHFYSGAGALFRVPDFVPHLQRVAARYGTGIHLSHDLVAVDGPKRLARFRTRDGKGNDHEVERPFDLLHVTPHPDGTRLHPREP